MLNRRLLYDIDNFVSNVSMSDNFPLKKSFNSGQYALSFIDVAIQDDYTYSIIECNGSSASLTPEYNYAGMRSRHLYGAIINAVKNYGSGIVLCCYKKNSKHIIEIERRFNRLVSLVNRDEELSNAVELRLLSIDSAAQNFDYSQDCIFFEGKKVILLTNPNLITNISMINNIDIDKVIDKYSKFFIDNSLLKVNLDKGLQQMFSNKTGFSPLEFKEAYSLQECQNEIKNFDSKYNSYVSKINAGSGARGIKFFSQDKTLDEKLKDFEVYLKNIFFENKISKQNTFYPIRFFPFIKSRPIIVDDKKHLWDIRFACLVYPKQILVYPTIVRICPKSFIGLYEWDSVVSNLTGRSVDYTYLRSPHDANFLFSAGLNKQILNKIALSCISWCVNAMNN